VTQTRPERGLLHPILEFGSKWFELEHVTRRLKHNETLATKNTGDKQAPALGSGYHTNQADQ